MCAVFISPRTESRGAVAGILILAALLLGPAPALGLPDDRLKAIEITAERAERNERSGFTLYSGAVVLVQGSLRIEADRLTIYHDRENADRIVALGEPARLQQQPALDREVVTASARRIVYQKSREMVVLQEAASIEQEGAIVTGESIRYFMAEERVQADAKADDDEARVQVFIPAEVIEEAQRDPEAPGDSDDAETPDSSVKKPDGDPESS